MNLYKRRKVKKSKEIGKTKVTYDETLPAGSSIGRIATNIWNSQKNPGKAYIFNRRVHHGEIGILLGLSNLFKKSRPEAAGVLSGLGESLSQMISLIKKSGSSLRKRKMQDTQQYLASRLNKMMIR
jgi:hypothetical protein